MPLLTGVTLLLLSSSCSRTYISTGDPGVPSPDGSSTRICWTIHGAYGRSFVERTKKSVDVCIKRGQQQNPQVLFLHTYRFVGGDSDADAKWLSPSNVVFHVLDDRNVARTNVLSVTFTLDKTGKFSEKR